MNSRIIFRSILVGLLASSGLLILYFSIITLISGWDFALDQFFSFWYFVIALDIGFGLQAGLYAYLKQAIKAQASSKLLAISGTTSTLAMVACCAHYLVNILPILGIGAFLGIISQYQVSLFWVGILFNLFGLIYILYQIISFRKHLTIKI